MRPRTSQNWISSVIHMTNGKQQLFSSSWDVVSKRTFKELRKMASVCKVLRQAWDGLLTLWQGTTFLLGGGHVSATDCQQVWKWAQSPAQLSSLRGRNCWSEPHWRKGNIKCTSQGQCARKLQCTVMLHIIVDGRKLLSCLMSKRKTISKGKFPSGIHSRG